MKSRRVASFAEEGKWTSGADSTLLIGDWQAWVDGDGHWKVRGPDPDNETHYADGDIELTEAEYTAGGNSAARRKIRARRAKEAARAYIKTMAQPSKRHHAMKKSPTQLQREIDEVLTTSRHPRHDLGWRMRVFNTHHAAQGFLNRIKKKHVAVIETHGPSQWRVAYLPEGEGMPLGHRSHATKKSRADKKMEAALAKARAMHPPLPKRKPSELSPIALSTELRHMLTMQRLRPTEERQRYIEELEAEQRERDARFG